MRTKRTRRALAWPATAGLLLALAWPAAGVAAQEDLPPSLSLHDGNWLREVLRAEGDGLTITVVECNQDGTSTVHFEAAGAAEGPYPGTFEATGEATLGPQTYDNNGETAGPLWGDVRSLDVAFAIASGETTITGTMEFDPSIDESPTPTRNKGYCGQRWPYSPGEVTGVANVSGSVAFEATIQTPAGTFRESGTAAAGAREAWFDPQDGTEPFRVARFTANFNHSDGPVPVAPDAPTSREQCRDGGHAAFGFRTQGRCVAFVERHTPDAGDGTGGGPAAAGRGDRTGDQDLRGERGKARGAERR